MQRKGRSTPSCTACREGGLIRCRLARRRQTGAQKILPLTPGARSIAGIDRVLGELRGLRQRLSRRLSANGGSQMKKQYIRQVRKDLHIPRSAKTEVVRDLQRFRLRRGARRKRAGRGAAGDAAEFADRTAEQFGFDPAARRRQNRLIQIAISRRGRRRASRSMPPQPRSACRPARSDRRTP